jgi:hypothetical protein
VLFEPVPVAVAIDSYLPTGVKVNELDALDVAEPVLLDAVTVKVYAVLSVNPLTVIGEDPVPVNPSGDDVAVKVVAAPPVVAAVYATDAVEPVPRSETAPIVGASGTSDIAVPDLVMPDALALLIFATATPYDLKRIVQGRHN